MCLIDAGLLIAYAILITHALAGVGGHTVIERIRAGRGSMNDRAEDDRVPQLGESRCGAEQKRALLGLRSRLHQLPPRHPNSQVPGQPGKKIPRHLQDSNHQDDDADNHYERDENMHQGVHCLEATHR